MYLRSDPLCGTLVRLLAFDLLSIQQHPHVPVDDGTGCTSCMFWTNQLTSGYFRHLRDSERQLQAAVAGAQVEQVKVGHLLRVQGRLSFFRDSLQIVVSSLVKEEDPNSESFHWMQAVQLALRCYDFPAVTQIAGEMKGNSSAAMDGDS